jgi:hypothetical protein
LIDFEKAEENAIREKIQEVDIHGCFFHFCQSVWRKAQSIGMEAKYIQDKVFRNFIKMFSALAFVEPQHVIAAFGDLAEMFVNEADNQQQEQQNADFLDYFERTWIGRPGRPPLFNTAMWNARNATLIDLPRTTNSAESWHHQLQSIFNAPHPNLFKFIKGLQLEQVRVNAVCVKLDGGQAVPLYSRREYEQANANLLRVLDRYPQMELQPYLKATSKYVKFRGADLIEEDDEDEEQSDEEESDEN